MKKGDIVVISVYYSGKELFRKRTIVGETKKFFKLNDNTYMDKETGYIRGTGGSTWNAKLFAVPLEGEILETYNRWEQEENIHKFMRMMNENFAKMYLLLDEKEKEILCAISKNILTKM